MTKAMTASRKSMRPQNTSKANDGQGTATSRKATAPKMTPEEAVEAARKAFGTSKAALSGVEAAATAYEAATANALGWVKVARATTLSARVFADLSGGDPNTLGRLRSTGDLIDASRKGKGTRTLTVREATKIANAQTRKAIDALISEMGEGGDPLGTKSVKGGTGHRDGVQGGKRKAQPKAGTLTTVKPATFVDTLGVILANLHRCSADALVEIARLGAEINEAATKEAATKRKAA